MIDDRNLKHAFNSFRETHVGAMFVCLEGFMGRYTSTAHEPTAHHILNQL